jgi:hypothetical protein
MVLVAPDAVAITIVKLPAETEEPGFPIGFR